MTLGSQVDTALAGLKDDYSRGAIGLDTFESSVATVLATDWPAASRPASLLATLLDGRRVAFVGRSPSCHLVLGDDSVSRMHAMITRAGSAYVLTDLESTNGTLVNGRRVRRAHVHPGDDLTLGESHLTL